MKKSKIYFLILATLFGIFMFIFGGIDDSPGGQLLGLVIVIASIVSIIRGRVRSKVSEKRDPNLSN